MTTNPSATEIGLGDLALRLAAELDAASETCQEAQALAACLAAQGGVPLKDLAPLQALDELTQRLSSLSLVLLRMGQNAGDHRLPAGAVLDDLGLSTLAKRLRQDGGAIAAPRAGEADLF